MEKDKTIFDFLGKVFCVYGITVTILILICWRFGEGAKEISSIFNLGKGGISLETLVQFLITSFLITGFQYLFFSEKRIKHMSGMKRSVCMLLSALAVTSGAIWIFGWFPVNMWEPWVYFLLCFTFCTAVSVFIVHLKTRTENRKLEEGLARMKEKMEKEEKKNES